MRGEPGTLVLEELGGEAMESAAREKRRRRFKARSDRKGSARRPKLL